MPRFFVDKNQIMETGVYIEGEDVKHIQRVLRLREGDMITVCDKCRTDYECRISDIKSDRVCAEIVSSGKNCAESDIYVTLYQGMPKSDKMDYIVQKCVELGASEIVPVITKRAVSRPNDADKKIARWQKIAEEAAKQCGRGVIPKIGKMLSFEEALSEMCEEHTLAVMPYERENEDKLRTVLCAEKKKNISIFIGPEGGFDDIEAAIARKRGVKTVTLGPRIMRTETAPLAVCAAVMYELGDW